MKRLFIGLASFFAVYALFGALGSKSFAPSVLTVIVFQNLVLFIFLYFLSQAILKELVEIGFSATKLYLKIEGNKGSRSGLYFIIIFVIVLISIIVIWNLITPTVYKTVVNFLVKIWNDLPSFAQVSPWISTVSSIISLILVYLSYRRENRKEQRETLEYVERREKESKKIIVPTPDEVLKYTKK